MSQFSHLPPAFGRAPTLADRTFRLRSGKMYVIGESDENFRIYWRTQQRYSDPARRRVSLAKLVAEGRWLPLCARPTEEAVRMVPLRQDNKDGSKGVLWLLGRKGHATGTSIWEFIGGSFELEPYDAIMSARSKLYDAWERPNDPSVGGLTFKSDYAEVCFLMNVRGGSEHECDVVASLLMVRPRMKLEERTMLYLQDRKADGTPVCALEKSFFASSQDGAGTVSDKTGKVTKISFEAKCPRKGDPYDYPKDYYMGQCLLHMEVEDSEVCYFTSFGATQTRAWLVVRHRELWGRIAAFIASVMACDNFTIDEACATELLTRAAALRRDLKAIAMQSKEIAGSPFPSYYVENDYIENEDWLSQHLAKEASEAAATTAVAEATTTTTSSATKKRPREDADDEGADEVVEDDANEDSLVAPVKVAPKKRGRTDEGDVDEDSRVAPVKVASKKRGRVDEEDLDEEDGDEEQDAAAERPKARARNA